MCQRSENTGLTDPRGLPFDGRKGEHPYIAFDTEGRSTLSDTRAGHVTRFVGSQEAVNAMLLDEVSEKLSHGGSAADKT